MRLIVCRVLALQYLFLNVLKTKEILASSAQNSPTKPQLYPSARAASNPAIGFGAEGQGLFVGIEFRRVQGLAPGARGADSQEEIEPRHFSGKIREILASHGRMVELEASRTQELRNSSTDCSASPGSLRSTG